MSHFRKKPVVIEAVQYVGTVACVDAIQRWAGMEQTDKQHDVWRQRVDQPTQFGPLLVHTLEGDLFAQEGDWIIRGVKGELYPCKPDIFAQTYEPVDTPAAAPPTVDDVKPYTREEFAADDWPGVARLLRQQGLPFIADAFERMTATARAGLAAQQEVTAAHDVLTLVGGLPTDGTLAERVGVLVSRAARSGRASADDALSAERSAKTQPQPLSNSRGGT